MDKETLNPDVEKKAKELCREISVAHELDEEIQEELLGHVEDKLIGYLDGKIPVTIDDAFLLAKNHFGDTALIKSLFQDVHVAEVSLSLGRRLGAAAIITMCCTFLSTLGTGFAWLLFTYLHAQAMTVDEIQALTTSGSLLNASDVAIDPLLALVLYMSWNVVVCLVPLALFVRWKKAMKAGVHPWFYRWRASSMWVMVLALVGLKVLIPYVPSALPFADTLMSLKYITLIAQGLVLVQCASWIWWCDNAPRTFKSILVSGSAWTLFFATITVLPHWHFRFGSVSALEPFAIGGQFSHADVYWALSSFTIVWQGWNLVMLFVSIVPFGLTTVIAYWLSSYVLNRIFAGRVNKTPSTQ